MPLFDWLCPTTVLRLEAKKTNVVTWQKYSHHALSLSYLSCLSAVFNIFLDAPPWRGQACEPFDPLAPSPIPHLLRTKPFWGVCDLGLWNAIGGWVRRPKLPLRAMLSWVHTYLLSSTRDLWWWKFKFSCLQALQFHHGLFKKSSWFGILERVLICTLACLWEAKKASTAIGSFSPLPSYGRTRSSSGTFLYCISLTLVWSDACFTPTCFVLVGKL